MKEDDNNITYLLFEKAARLYSDDCCLLFQNTSLTYRQLEDEVQKVHLLLLKYAANEKIIGLPTTRGIDQLIFMLAILKAGKAYLPIDFGYPKSRIENIIKNSNLTFCLSTKEDEANAIEMGLRLLKDDNNQIPTDCKQDLMAQNAAYILYTSGSTGEPKGVCMGQEAIVNLINWQNKNSKSKNGTRTLQFAPLTFDVSFQEIMATLSTGGTLVLIDDALRLDMVALLSFIKEQQINRLFLPFVALQAIAEAALSTGVFPDSLNEIMTAGEQLKITPQVSAFFTKLKDCNLYNQYGPTECHVVTELKLDGNPVKWPTLPTIGKPISNTSILILNPKQEIVENGEIGELYIAGECLAEGYLNNKQLTDEKFLDWKSPEGKIIRIYRSGDIAKYLPDGNIEFLGRQDDQVKISGHRIELAEVELAINTLNGILQTVVVASNHLGQTQLVAYIQPNKEEMDVVDIRKKVSNILPDYMVPSYFVLVEDFPKTSSGKIDKKVLPAPEYIRPSSAPLYKKATTKIQKDVTTVWINLLHIPKIGIDDNFFELGGTSLLSQKLVAALLKDYNYKLPVTKLYQFPRIAEIAHYLEPNKNTETKKNIKRDTTSNTSRDIAIIGMAGRFPGAENIQELWEVLKEGKETISFFSKDELDNSISDVLRNDPLYVRARGIVPSVKEFDAAFFGLNPKVASVMDPQQRLFLEIAWEVLEQSGYLPKHYDGTIGVYAGSGMNTYYKNNILPNKEVLEQVGDFQSNTLNEKDYISSRVAYHLNLKGPAVSVHSACSTSLLAIAEAVEAIRNGQCEIALAGGSSITAPIYSGHLYAEGSMFSPDGHCRSFDKEGKGTVFSDGAGVVLLKSLESAKIDGDFIYGVIKGIGINNDGGGKGSFTAPSAEGQSGAITRALDDANIDASEISYVEAHGTATPIGDPIEMEGLNAAFGTQSKNGYCAVGSIKSNIGHLTAAAGVAGLIKTILAINHRLLPPTLGFSEANPSIDFENSPFFVNNKLQEWNVENIRRAGISSFGVGGTNVHIVVEEYLMEPKSSDLGRPLQIISWSAKTENSLSKYGNELGKYLTTEDSISLADVSYTLKFTRDSFNHRKFILANNTAEVAQKLLSDESFSNTSILKNVPSELFFLFPGQGAQYLQMGKSLYEHEDVFRKAVDVCAEVLKTTMESDIREIIFPKTNTPEAEEKLKDTRFTQPALFVIEYALARLWMSWGIKPTAFCGHSIGEFVGAHLAGVFSLEDGLHLIATRGRLVSELPEGSMLSVRLASDKLMEFLPKNLSMAAINSDQLSVVSGIYKDIENFIKILEEKEIPNKLLATSHAFHSFMMDPILETFKNEVESIKLNTPNTPIVSSVTGTWLTDEEATNTEYWTNHLRATVNFSLALDTILKLEDSILLEVGPGKALTTLALQKKAAKSKTILSSLPIPKNNDNSYPELFNTLGNLWLRGVDPDWQSFYGEQTRQKLKLPSYAFDRKPCWVNPILQEASFKTNKIQFENPIEMDKIIEEKSNNIIPMRKPIILKKISELITNASGIELESSEHNHSFILLGLDSLVLTQIAINCKREFKTPITFRQLNEEFGTPELLATYLDKILPVDVYAPAEANNLIKPTNQVAPIFTESSQNHYSANNQNTALSLITQQLKLLGKQVELLKGSNELNNNVAHTNGVSYAAKPEGTKPNIDSDLLSEEEKLEHKKPFGASPKIEIQSADLNDEQKLFLQSLTQRYNKKTLSSKKYTQEHRAHMADPRVVSGFKPLTKELVYPIVVEKSLGNRLWDLDGNEYMDVLNGFGSSLFGHQPEFIKEALKKQIDLGYEVGPQHPLAGEVCKLLCEITGHDRAALCNTGSEAVLGAIRIARTVTGRSLIVAFSGSYHGINDEVLVRGSQKLKTFPAAPGILPEAVQNMLILEYGTDESLRIIREKIDEIAAVLVEPVQSRRPDFQPINFLKEIRKITESSETVLIFDEVITGFRMHLGGAQALFDIKADIATYGKVIGGGLPIGAIIGKRKFMDALDGGFWQYGDASYPEVGVTYFAGTFVRHPLALAAAKASLRYMKKEGESLQNNLSKLTKDYATNLNQEFEKRQLPIQIKYYGSLWRLKFEKEITYSELLFVLLRERGIHIWDGFPCFVTTAYTKEDLVNLTNAFLTSIDELTANGFLNFNLPNHSESDNDLKSSSNLLNKPPIPGARLGLDEKGNPAWFIASKDQNNEYVKIDL